MSVQSGEFSRRSLLGSASTIAASMALATALPRGAASRTAPEPLTAIDTLLDPDQTMVQKAIAANARLRESFPKGFALRPTDDLRRFQHKVIDEIAPFTVKTGSRRVRHDKGRSRHQ